MDPDTSSDPTRLRRSWTLAFLVGELVGFVPPAVTGATLGALGSPDAVMVVGLTAAGLLEGAALGAAQARVLARHAPGVDGRAWVVATAAAAGFAWFAGMGGGALMGADVAPPGVLLAFLVPVWVLALVGMGALQWRVLHRAVPRSLRWVPVTAGAWAVGVVIPVVVISSVPNEWPVAVHVGAAVVAAVAMGLTVGSLTGHTLERLLRRDAAPSRPAGR